MLEIIANHWMAAANKAKKQPKAAESTAATSADASAAATNPVASQSSDRWLQVALHTGTPQVAAENTESTSNAAELSVLEEHNRAAQEENAALKKILTVVRAEKLKAEAGLVRAVPCMCAWLLLHLVFHARLATPAPGLSLARACGGGVADC